MNASTSKKGTFIIPLIIGILIAGALVYYFWPKFQQESSETPPSITVSSSKFQGLISGECKIPGYAFTDNQVSGYIKPGADNDAKWHALDKGVHIYHSAESLTIQEVINSIIPTANNKIIIAYYPADKENAEKKFAVYPSIEGQTQVDNPAAYLLPANQGFVIISCDDTKIWKVKIEKMSADAVTTTLNNKDAGWILIPAYFDDGVFASAFLTIHKAKIKSAWVQQGAGFDFKKVENLAQAQLIGDWKMIWLKIGPADVPAAPAANNPAAIPQTIGITAKTGGNKQVIIEWKNVSADQQDISQYLIFRSKQPNVAVTCPDNCQYVNFNPLGNLVGSITFFADQSKEFTDNLLLEDNTKYYYIIKSRNLDKNDMVGTSAEFSVKTLPAAAVAEINNDMNAIVDAVDAAAAEMKENMDKAMEDVAAAFSGWGNMAGGLQTITVTLKKWNNSQVEIEWTDSAQGIAIDGYMIFRSINPNMDIKFPESYKMVNANPPGNRVGNVAANANKIFIDNILLINNTTYYYVIKSVKIVIEEIKVLGTSPEFSVTTKLLPPPV